MTRIPFSGRITLDTFIAAQLAHWGWKRHVPLVVGLLVVGSTLLNTSSPLTLAGMLPALGGLAFIPVLALLTRSTWKKVHRDTPAFHQAFAGSLEATGYVAQSALGTSHLPWYQFTQAKVTDKVILLYTGPVQFHLLGPDMFTGPQTWDEARALVRRCIPKQV